MLQQGISERACSDVSKKSYWSVFELELPSTDHAAVVVPVAGAAGAPEVAPGPTQGKSLK